MNVGIVPTCVNPRGCSVVDLTWTSADTVDRVIGWQVNGSGESLSDHCYVRYTITGWGTTDGARDTKTYPRRPHPRWNYSKMDPEILTAVLEWHCGVSTNTTTSSMETADTAASWIDATLKEACDMVAPRAGKFKRKKNTHWWSPRIAELRSTCITARRELTKFNSRNRDNGVLLLDALTSENRLCLRREYRRARDELRAAIYRAKTESWKELLTSVETDPWGRPYMLVLKRLGRPRTALTETLEEAVREELLESLFTSRGEDVCKSTYMERDWDEGLAVRPAEVTAAIRRKHNRNAAPGLDGIRFVV